METRSESTIMTNPGPVTAPQTSEHFDVVIVGAGISGVGGAYHLTKQ
jgi:ribulose 1,5-bisphosphate synthetase/thiazole synthase